MSLKSIPARILEEEDAWAADQLEAQEWEDERTARWYQRQTYLERYRRRLAEELERRARILENLGSVNLESDDPAQLTLRV